MRRFPLIAALCLFLLAAEANAATAHISWTFKQGTENYVNDQTKLAFRKFVGGFRLKKANLGEKDGTATFQYHGKYGIISAYLAHRGPSGCGKGEDCAAHWVNSFRVEMKKLHGKYDLERSFGLQWNGSPRGSGTMYHFLAFGRVQGTPAYSEVGAVQVGEFVYCYRATFFVKKA